MITRKQIDIILIELLKKDFTDKELVLLKKINERGFLSNEDLKNIYNLNK